MEYTLKKLTDWRDQGGGPKIGIIDNFDERLENILTGIMELLHHSPKDVLPHIYIKLMGKKLSELNIRSFFDFVLVSQKTASEKPSAEMFHLARQTCGM